VAVSRRHGPAPIELTGAVVAVTGASRGIGRAVARAALGRGAKVGLIARDRADLDAVLAPITAGRGGHGFVAPADVGDRDAVFAAMASIAAELGPIDVLVANAGIGAYGAFADVDVAEVERLLRTNVLGTVHAIHAVLPGMLARRRGHIVTVGSIAGRIGSPFEAAYSASKFAQVGLTEAIAVELAPYGIGVSMVQPGPVATDFGAARGHPYDRDRPKPVPPERVADDVIRAIEGGRLERYVPGWFRPAVVVRHLLPRLYLRGATRSMRRELAADRSARDRRR
jgi:short-subunit dehydrogenase